MPSARWMTGPSGVRQSSRVSVERPSPFLKATRHALALQGKRRAVEQVVIRAHRVDVERVDLLQVGGVVGRRPAEVAIEAADDAERPADAEVAVEVEHARHGDVRLVVAGVPVEVRIAQEDRLAGLGAARRERPRVGALLDRIGLLAFRRLAGGLAPGAPDRARIDAGEEAARLRQRRDAHVARRDVVAGEMGREAARKLLRMPRDVAVHAGGEALVHVARRLVEVRVALDRGGVAALRDEVALDAVAAEPAPQLAPAAQQADGDSRAVVLELYPGQRIGGRLQVLGPDVRNPVRGAANLDLPRKLRRVALRPGRVRGGETGQREEQQESA